MESCQAHPRTLGILWKVGRVSGRRCIAEYFICDVLITLLSSRVLLLLVSLPGGGPCCPLSMSAVPLPYPTLFKVNHSADSENEREVKDASSGCV